MSLSFPKKSFQLFALSFELKEMALGFSLTKILKDNFIFKIFAIFW